MWDFIKRLFDDKEGSEIMLVAAALAVASCTVAIVTFTDAYKPYFVVCGEYDDRYICQCSSHILEGEQVLETLVVEK